jgi:hypothetical protein
VYQGFLAPGVQRSEREVNQSAASIAEVKNVLELYLDSPICLHGMVLNWAWGHLYLTLFNSKFKPLQYENYTKHKSVLIRYSSVAGSIPDEVIGFVNWLNPSSRTMALGSTKPLTEMSTRNLPVGKGRPACEADNLTAVSRLSRKCGSLDGSQPYGPQRPVKGIARGFFNVKAGGTHGY